MQLFLLFLLASAFAFLPVPSRAAPASERTVVVLLFDGVAPALLELAPVPAFERMRREGAWTHGFEPPFPSISLIGGFTISMGCWPEHHGIVTNKFLDGDGRLYDHSRDADWTTGCEHLHEVAEKQGVRAAALDWYGARSHSRGPLASWVDGTPDHDSFPEDAVRANEVAQLLALPPEQRPRLILAYFRGPDSAAHFSGMESDQARQAVVHMDAAVARVMAAIEAGPGRARTALFVTTDHGMAPVTTIVNIERLLRWHDIPAHAVSTGTTAFLYFDDAAAVEPAAQALSAYEEFEVLRREALPDYARLGAGPRVPPLIVSAKPPYFIEDASQWPFALRWMGRFGPRFSYARPFLKATHGYPPATPGMAGILYAWGDGIAAGREVARARAVDVHPTVTSLLGIAPGSPLDGAPLGEFLTADEGF
jgi:predicted AlkP superfamily pyrophosphatase or phosphodiesterase